MKTNPTKTEDLVPRAFTSQKFIHSDSKENSLKVQVATSPCSTPGSWRLALVSLQPYLCLLSGRLFQPITTEAGGSTQ